jgi:hypothetical protein
MNKEYFYEVTEGVIIFVQFETEKGDVEEFVVKLLCEMDDKWHEVLRHDSGHGCPHRDVLNPSSREVRKIWYDFLDNSQALTMAISDIKENHEFYIERYSKWLKEN